MSVVFPGVILLSVLILNSIVLGDIMLSVAMLNVIILKFINSVLLKGNADCHNLVIMAIVVVLNVVAPLLPPLPSFYFK